MTGITDHRNCAAEAEQCFEKTEQAWEETQGEVDQVMGSWIGPKENGTKEARVVRNKELSTRKQTGNKLIRNKIGG